MESYGEFAKVYDLFMDNVPYEEWKAHLISVLENAGITDGLILDLGCGTGKMTRLLSDSGYDMIGVDGSEEMLMEARSWFDEDAFSEEDALWEDDDAENDAFLEGEDATAFTGMDEPGILYLCQDMTEFELYGTVRAIVSVCDCMNYLLTEEDLLQCFKLANNYLDPKGLFIFDMNSLAKYRAMGEKTICENREEGSFIWENYYNEENGENEYNVTFYIRDDVLYGEDEIDDSEGEEELGCSESYVRFEETHLQKGYEIERIKELLIQAGLEFVGVYDGYSDQPATEESERLLFVAREQGK